MGSKLRSKPCEDCPFNPDGPGLRLRRSLRPGRWKGILASLREGSFFPCHKTTQEDDDGEYIPGTGLVCAGAIAWQDERGCTSNYVRIVRRLEAGTRNP